MCCLMGPKGFLLNCKYVNALFTQEMLKLETQTPKIKDK